VQQSGLLLRLARHGPRGSRRTRSGGPHGGGCGQWRSLGQNLGGQMGQGDTLGHCWGGKWAKYRLFLAKNC
jgi:hypothetical protein